MTSSSRTSSNTALLAMQKMGLIRPIDKVLHIPFRYEDETQLSSLEQAKEGDTVQCQVKVLESTVVQKPRRQLRVRVGDGSAQCWLRFFHFYPMHQKLLALGNVVRIRGEIKKSLLGNEMVHPSIKSAYAPLSASLTPVYSSVAGLSQAYLRKAIASAMSQVDLSETLPPESLKKLPIHTDWTLKKSLQFLHTPQAGVSLDTLEDKTHPAWQRLKAEEWLAQQLSQQLAKKERMTLKAPSLKPLKDASLTDDFKKQLPFQLTLAQERVTQEIAKDLVQAIPMHRLLQGDVGSGKTVVAALAACICIDAGWQCALMAPTEILAAQHFAKLKEWLASLLERQNKSIVYLTGAQTKSAREKTKALIANGQAALIVGTQALIQQDMVYSRLGLAIVDEQHRFGVAQRLALRAHLGAHAHTGGIAHLLMMTATPIPRSLAMTMMADLDVSTIDELPPGRTPVLTKVIAANKRQEMMHRVCQQMEQGRQIYWVCPLIEESETLDLRHATMIYEELCQALKEQGKDDWFPVTGIPKVALLHARLPSQEKKAVMQAFVEGHIQLLVSTTVIEVGVDVPNASLMIIEHAERFGLSQLHQLRGRVGRGAASSICILLYEPPLGDVARQRLSAMATTHDGFELAKLDLQIRGAGEFLGLKQSGSLGLRFADLQTDEHLLEWAKSQAQFILTRHPHQARQHIERWMSEKTEYFKA